MKKFATVLFLLFTAIGHAKVYDCFMFYNEFELLKMRLEELNDSVDYFVLVESIETQRGDPKPLYFMENRSLYEKYLDKIIHVVVEEKVPAEQELWVRENFQRSCIYRGLQQCDPSDVILISDLDEIPRANIVDHLRAILPKKNAKLLNKDKHYLKHHGKKEKNLVGGIALEMPIYFYQLNRSRQVAVGDWVGTVATTYGIFRRLGAQYFRDHRWIYPKIYRGGWHFTWMGGKDKVRQKWASVVEGDPQKANVSDEELEKWMEQYPVVPIDESFPSYVHRNLEDLKAKGFIADF